MNAAENVEQFGDIAALDAMQAEAANDAGPAPGDAYDELNNREANGGGSWPFDPVIAENCALFAGIGFGIVAKKRGDHWAIQQDDQRRVGVAVAQVIHKYMPEIDNVGPVGNLAIVAASLVGPRMLLDAMTKAKEQPKQLSREAANDEYQD